MCNKCSKEALDIEISLGLDAVLWPLHNCCNICPVLEDEPTCSTCFHLSQLYSQRKVAALVIYKFYTLNFIYHLIVKIGIRILNDV